MRRRILLVLAILGLTLGLAQPASAAPACAVPNWTSGDTCTFEAPAGAFAFGGVATASDGREAWIAVEVVFNGVVIASCYAQGSPVASCHGTAQAFAPTFTHTCRVYGTGGPYFQCADPPALPSIRN